MLCFHVLTNEVCANNQKELSYSHGELKTKLFGRENWLPGTDANGFTSHGTAMTAALAGDVMGVAKRAKLVPIAYEYSHTRYLLLDCLDWIYADWLGRAASLDPTLAPLGVLSLSLGYPVNQGELPGYYELRMAAALQRLVDHGILPIASAGNDGVSNFFPLYP
jgi:subtilisin family serine protease